MSAVNTIADNQLQAAIFVFAGALIGKLIDWLLGRYGKSVDRQTSLEAQLWDEIHDLRERYDSQEDKYFERIQGFQLQISKLETDIDKLKSENIKLRADMVGFHKVPTDMMT